MIEYDENLGILRNKIVPKRVSENNFWKNYFYNIEIIKYKYNVNNLINKNVGLIENNQHSIKININEEKKELETEKTNNENKSRDEIKEKIEKNDYIINFDSHNLIDYENICNILEKVQNNIDEKEKIKEIIKEYRIERRKRLHNPVEYISTIESYETEIRTLQLKGILDLMKIDPNLFWHSFFYEKESHPQIIEKLMEIRFFLCLDFSNKKIEKKELDKIRDHMNNKKSDIINEFIDSIQAHKSTNELNKKLHKSIFLYILISDVIYELFNVEEEDIKFSIKELIELNQKEGEDLSEDFHNLYCNEIPLLTNIDFIN